MALENSQKIRQKIQRREFLLTFGLTAVGIGRLSCFPVGQAGGRRPNIILILIDDLGWKDTGYMGNKFYETPHIDKLAASGIIFTNAYANAPNCAPTRASLLTGLYPPRHGIYTVNRSDRGKSIHRRLIPTPNTTTLAPRFVTIAEVLHKAGYRTASIGKWHLGDDPDFGPRSQGFDVNIGGNHLGHPKSYFSPYRNPALSDGPPGEYLTERLTAEALKFIQDNRNRPFFLYLSHYAVHSPWQAKKYLTTRFYQKNGHHKNREARYAAMIASVDEGVGKIVALVQKLGISRDTVIFFLSDNGGNGRITSMTPLRGSKGMLYEGGIRVPMVVTWPGRISPGSRCDTPVITSDLFPTILDLTNSPRPQSLQIDGESLLPLLTCSGGLKRDAIFWHFPAYLEAYQGMKGPWRTTPAGAIRMGDWKLIEFFETGKLELYNLKRDIGEQHDLAKSMPQKTRELHQILIQWQKKVKAPIPTQLNPDYRAQIIR